MTSNQPQSSRRSSKRGAYSGRKEYTIHTKVKMHIPLNDEEREQYRQFQHDKNHKQYVKRCSTVHGKATELLKAARKRAQLDGRECTLSLAWIENKLRIGKCELTDRDFDFSPTTDGRTNPYTASIDKIDPHGHYSENNCRVVTWRANRAKGDHDDNMLYELACDLMRKQMRETTEPDDFDFRLLDSCFSYIRRFRALSQEAA